MGNESLTVWLRNQFVLQGPFDELARRLMSGRQLNAIGDQKWTIFLKAVLNFDQSQPQDQAWLMFFPSKMYKRATKRQQGKDTWGPRPGLVWELRGVEWREVASLEKGGPCFPDWPPAPSHSCKQTWAAHSFIQSKATAFWKSST